MTARITHLTVVLEKPKREDDVQFLVDAIRMFRGVLNVTKVECTSEFYSESYRIKAELHRKLFDVIHPPREES